jgi:hypothetical protein
MIIRDLSPARDCLIRVELLNLVHVKPQPKNKNMNLYLMFRFN